MIRTVLIHPNDFKEAFAWLCEVEPAHAYTWEHVSVSADDSMTPMILVHIYLDDDNMIMFKLQFRCTEIHLER